MAEDRTEVTFAQALELPLFKRNFITGSENLIAGNLKNRFAHEVAKYMLNIIKTKEKRELLNIEQMDADSVIAFQNDVLATIDKLAEKDRVKFPISKEGYSNLAQYLSWSYFQGTGHTVEDKEYDPKNPVLNDVKKLFFQFKADAEK